MLSPVEGTATSSAFAFEEVATFVEPGPFTVEWLST
jgi:hypothetical protein